MLAQIGLGYFFVYLLLGRGVKLQIGVAAVVLIAYTAWLLLFPAPDPLPAAAADSIHSLSVPEVIARHYALGTNAAAQTDLVAAESGSARQAASKHIAAGYATLNFIPVGDHDAAGCLGGTLLKSPLSSGRQTDASAARWLVVHERRGHSQLHGVSGYQENLDTRLDLVQRCLRALDARCAVLDH